MESCVWSGHFAKEDESNGSFHEQWGVMASVMTRPVNRRDMLGRF